MSKKARLEALKSVYYFNYYTRESCGCCNGIQWGGWEPIECDRCGGNASVFKTHKGRYVKWIGGPFC